MPPGPNLSTRSSREDSEADSRRRLNKRSLSAFLADGITKKTRTGAPVGPYQKVARWIGRSEDTFLMFNAVFAVGMKHSGITADYSDDEDEVEDALGAVDEATQAHYIRIYRLIAEKISSFRSDVNKFIHKPADIDTLCQYMNVSLSVARSDDIKSLRELGLSYVTSLQPDKTLVPNIPPNSSKQEHRGWKHPVLARLLCPIEYFTAYEADPVGTRQKLLDGKLSVHSEQLALYMYRGQTVNAENVSDGLFCSELIKMTWRHIFQGPRSAAEGRHVKLKRAQAELNDLTAVTPRTIAYATLQTRWYLCGVDDWRMDDGNVIKKDLFNTVLGLFESDESKSWASATLEEWNSEMFPKPPAGGSGPGSNSVTTFFAQFRAARAQLTPMSPRRTFMDVASRPASPPLASRHASPPVMSRPASPPLSPHPASPPLSPHPASPPAASSLVSPPAISHSVSPAAVSHPAPRTSPHRIATASSSALLPAPSGAGTDSGFGNQGGSEATRMTKTRGKKATGPRKTKKRSGVA